MEQLDGEPASRILKFAKEHGVITSFDVLAVATPKLTEVVNMCLPYVDFFMPNYEEAEMICGLRGRQKILRYFLDRGVKHTVLRMGANGSTIGMLEGGVLREIRTPAFDVPIVDSTGCGDAYHAGFIKGLSLGLTESLANLSPIEWRTILARLRRARLLAGEDPHHPGYVDTHPLVREYYGEQLRGQRSEAWQECNKRLFNYYRALAPQLPDSFAEMEPLFLAVICGCNAGLFREALHEVYIPRIQRGNVHFAANVLGATGPLLSVLGQFFERGRWGSLIETAIEGQWLTEEDQLFILMQAGLYLTATRGMGAPETRICYERTEPLCHSVNHPRLLFMQLLGQFRYALHTDKLSVAMRIAERVHALAQEQNDAGLMLAAYQVFLAIFYFLGEFDSARKYARRGVQIWRSGSVQSPIAEEIQAPVVNCLVYEAITDWHFGEIASCHALMDEGISIAKELKDTNALVLALSIRTALAHLERDPAEVDRFASGVIEFSTRHNLLSWLVLGTIYRG